jgi:Zn-dependent protease
MFRRFGNDCHVVLHMFGGLAIPGQEPGPSSWGFQESFSRQRQPTLQEQILISFAGPAAGFILAAVTIMVVQATGGHIELMKGRMGIPAVMPFLPRGIADNVHLLVLVQSILFINIYWGLMNLLPVYPLDGGQIAMAVMVLKDPWRGTEKALWISMVTGGVAAVVGGLVLQELWLLFLFGSLAYSSYMALQQLGGGGGRGW